MESEDGPEMTAARIACQFCGRKFAPESLGKHVNVCEKTSNKKRKTFDSAKQRVRGTELAEFAPVIERGKRNETVVAVQPPHPMLKGKRNLVEKITEDAVSSSSAVSSRDTRPPRKTVKTTSNRNSNNKSSNYQRCSYCDRSFGPKAFDRHLEWCKEQSIRINLKSNTIREAKERLDARIKYQAPSFKSKRSITKEKYSPKLKNHDSRIGSNVTNDDDDDRRTENEIKSNPSPYPNEAKTITSDIFDKSKLRENKEVNFIRQNVLRCSLKARLPKKTDNKADKDKTNNFHNFDKSDFSGLQNWISANGTKIEPSVPASKISPPANSRLSNSIYDGYDPYLLAEHQMKELFGDETSCDLRLNRSYSSNKRPLKEDRLHKMRNKENILYERGGAGAGALKNKLCQTNDDSSKKLFKTSPTSAFSEYAAAKKTGNERNSPGTGAPSGACQVEKRDYNFLPPISNVTSTSTSTSTIADLKYGGCGGDESLNCETSVYRYPLVSLSNLSLCSSVSVDIPDIPDEGNRKTTNSSSLSSSSSSLLCRDVGAANLSDEDDPRFGLAERSVSTISDKPCKSQKKNLRMEHLLYGSEDQKEANFAGETFDRKLEELNNFLDDDNFDLTNSFAEFENALRDSRCDKDDVFRTDTGSPTNDKFDAKLRWDDSTASKTSVDSAYNSLNRKSPTIYDSPNFTGKTLTPESEMAESPAAAALHFHEIGHRPKLSKFCHECGAKFPLAIAKFCCECGVRRLAI